MNHYVLFLLIAGMASLGMAFMPAVSKRTGISYSLIYVTIGVVIYLLMGDRLPTPLPSSNRELTLHLTELIVIISLMGTGIKIDRSFSLSAMVLSIETDFYRDVALYAGLRGTRVYMLNFTLTAALLLGAVLVPTDPVLASDVQVGAPNEKFKSETRFALTSEAGLNDGFAFPFTWFAIIVATTSFQSGEILEWFGYYFGIQNSSRFDSGLALRETCRLPGVQYFR